MGFLPVLLSAALALGISLQDAGGMGIDDDLSRLEAGVAALFPSRTYKPRMRLPVWVLSLELRQDRLDILSSGLLASSTPYEVVEAVDGRKLKHSQDDFRFRSARHFKKELTAGMKGCVLSHQKLWARLAGQDGATVAGTTEDSQRQQSKNDFLQVETAGSSEGGIGEGVAGEGEKVFQLVLEDDAIVPPNLLENANRALQASPEVPISLHKK